MLLIANYEAWDDDIYIYIYGDEWWSLQIDDGISYCRSRLVCLVASVVFSYLYKDLFCSQGNIERGKEI